MKLTNKYNLPESFVRAVRNDPYKSSGDISVTRLIDSPQINYLREKYKDSIVEDVSEKIWILLGQGVHSILERSDHGGKVKVEERLTHEINGMVLSGQFDRLDLDNKALQDYKVTSTYKKDGDISWERQLNVLAFLARKNNYEVEKLQIIAVFRDWSRAKLRSDPDYPKVNVKVIDVPMWTEEKCLNYIGERISLFKESKLGNPKPCTDEERWMTPEKWAIKKPNAKRATKLFDKKPMYIDPGMVLEHRPGKANRCEDYCNVKNFCPQWSKEN